MLPTRHGLHRATPSIRDRSEVKTSVTPSTKYFCSGSPDNVLQLLFGEIDEGNFEFVTHMPVGVLRQADRARLANALHARGDVDAIAHQVAVGLLDHVAEQ
jgi:hypothetical protein